MLRSGKGVSKRFFWWKIYRGRY